MKKLTLFALTLAFGIGSAHAGVLKFAAKESKSGLKHAAHYSAKAGKVAKKILY